MIRLSDKSDSEIAEMKLLWKEYFGDSDEFIDFYFEKICARNKIVIMREDGILTGMLHLNPYIFSADRKEIIRTYYVVGVMVREGYRKQGRMKKMFDYAYSVLSSERIKFIYLWPANEAYYGGVGFSTVTQMVDITFKREDLELLRDEMVTAKCDMEFGKLIRNLIMPEYSAENISSMVSEMCSEGGSFSCLEKMGTIQGCYSIIRNGDTLEVDHIVPYFGLREYTGRLFDSIEEALARYDDLETEIRKEIDTENAGSDGGTDNASADSEAYGHPDAVSADSEADDHPETEDDQSIKFIKITMDYRIMQCYKHTLDMNQVSLSRKYMAAALEELPFDPGNLLFSEIV